NRNEHQTEGYYWWKDFAERPYECTMLFRSSFRGRSWSPFLLTLSLNVEECTIENYSARLQFTKDKLILLIENLNEGFKFSAPEGEIFSDRFLDGLITNNILDKNGCLLIQQDQDGVDLIDRIEKCACFLNNLAIEK